MNTLPAVARPTNMDGKLAAVIVAAGISSRMRGFKPLLPLGDESLLCRIVRLMQSSGAQRVTVVTGYRHEELEAHLAGMGTDFVYNPRFAQTQMFDSVKLGLMAAGADCQRVLLSPADVPIVLPQTIQHLLASPGDFVRPMHHGRRGHPVVLNASIIPALLGCSGDKGLRGAIRTLGVEAVDVPVEDEGVLFDVDTREDYARLLRKVSQAEQRAIPLRPSMRLSLGTDESFFDQEAAQFLEMIRLTGSMNLACKAMHMAYSKGWATINAMEERLQQKVLTRSAGGAKGGGSQLTPEGEQFLQAYQKMAAELGRHMDRLFKESFPQPKELKPL